MKKYDGRQLQVQYKDIIFVQNSIHLFHSVPINLMKYSPSEDTNPEEFVIINDKEVKKFFLDSEFLIDYSKYLDYDYAQIEEERKSIYSKQSEYEDRIDKLADSFSYHIAEKRYPEYVFYGYQLNQINALLSEKKSIYCLQFKD